MSHFPPNLNVLFDFSSISLLLPFSHPTRKLSIMKLPPEILSHIDIVLEHEANDRLVLDEGDDQSLCSQGLFAFQPSSHQYAQENDDT